MQDSEFNEHCEYFIISYYFNMKRWESNEGRWTTNDSKSFQRSQHFLAWSALIFQGYDILNDFIKLPYCQNYYIKQHNACMLEANPLIAISSPRNPIQRNVTSGLLSPRSIYYRNDTPDQRPSCTIILWIKTANSFPDVLLCVSSPEIKWLTFKHVVYKVS